MIIMLALYPGSSTKKWSLGTRLCSCHTIQSETKSTVKDYNCGIAALLAYMYLPLHNLAVQMLLPSVGECCGPAKETKAACMHLDVPPAWASPAYTTCNTTVEPRLLFRTSEMRTSPFNGRIAQVQTAIH